MDEDRRLLWVLLVSAMLCVSLFRSQAQASERSGVAGGGNLAGAAVPSLRSPAEASSLPGVRAAVRLLNQAALQRNFASDSRIRELLRSARDELVASEPGLCCIPLARVLRLEAEVEGLMHPLGPGRGSLAGSPGVSTRPPNRGELVLLARDGQGIVRGEERRHPGRHDELFVVARDAVSIPAFSTRSPPRGFPDARTPAPSDPEALPMVSLRF